MSVAALLHRAHDLGAITDEGYRRAMVQMTVKGWRTTEPLTGLQSESPEMLSTALSMIGTATSVSIEEVVQDLRLGMEDIEAITGSIHEDRRPRVRVPQVQL